MKIYKLTKQTNLQLANDLQSKHVKILLAILDRPGFCIKEFIFLLINT